MFRASKARISALQPPREVNGIDEKTVENEQQWREDDSSGAFVMRTRAVGATHSPPPSPDRLPEGNDAAGRPATSTRRSSTSRPLHTVHAVGYPTHFLTFSELANGSRRRWTEVRWRAIAEA